MGLVLETPATKPAFARPSHPAFCRLRIDREPSALQKLVKPMFQTGWAKHFQKPSAMGDKTFCQLQSVLNYGHN
jgi:hypothetical protein